MNQWLIAQVGRELGQHEEVTVVLDPDALLTVEDIDEMGADLRVVRAASWLELRRLWDLDIRRKETEASTVVVIANDQFRTSDNLPWDVEHEASSVVRLRVPVPQQLHALFRSAPKWRDELAAATTKPGSENQVVARAFGITPGSPTSELEAVTRFRQDPTTPPELWHALTTVLTTSPAVDVARAGGELSPLQVAWVDWLEHGAASPMASVLSAAPGPLVTLLGSGLLAPVPLKADGLPSWVGIGGVDPDPGEMVGELLEAEPPDAGDIDGWIGIASWWGQVRAAVAAQAIESSATQKAWEAWVRIDEQFRSWLLESYGRTLLSAASPPRSIDRIASFLARRVEHGSSVVLVVVDGMSFAQWHQIRSMSRLTVLQATGCLAMIPTLTTSSRQAIFAGALPTEFVESIRTTSQESRRWSSFWTGQGLADRDVTYIRTMGADISQVPSLAGRAVGIVVNAIDEMMHGAEVLGDRQLAASTALWVNAGFLETLVQQATSQGFEVWITADHGNLPSMPAERGVVKREGQLVEHAGTRVRLYPNEILRDAAGFGTTWDPPGYPPEAQAPLFADGRFGFHATGTRVSHGGLSLDEVIVPFVQVTV